MERMARWYGMLIRHAVKIVIFSPVIAPHAAALHVRDISDRHGPTSAV